MYFQIYHDQKQIIDCLNSLVHNTKEDISGFILNVSALLTIVISISNDIVSIESKLFFFIVNDGIDGKETLPTNRKYMIVQVWHCEGQDQDDSRENDKLLSSTDCYCLVLKIIVSRRILIYEPSKK